MTHSEYPECERITCMSSLKQEGANFREMRNAEYFSQFSDHHFLSPLCIPDGRSVRSLKRAAADQRSPGSGSLYLPPPPAAESRLNNLQLWIYCIYFDALMVALKTKGQAVAMSAIFSGNVQQCFTDVWRNVHLHCLRWHAASKTAG